MASDKENRPLAGGREETTSIHILVNSPETFDISADVKARQCALVYEALHRGPASTLDLRDGLGVMSPASRVMELRRAGVEIRTEISVTFDVQGRPHRSGVYVLVKPAAAVGVTP